MDHSGRLRILIAEDHQDFADSLNRLLEMLGHETFVTCDGEAAVSAAAALRPDVILMDIGLPKLDGYHATRRIRAQHSAVRPLIVAWTGWGEERDRRRSVEAGIDHHLIKPSEFPRLQQILESFERVH